MIVKIDPIELKDKLEVLPRSPGVYVMKNKAGEVIYVGKAGNLRQRVKNYFRGGGDGRAQIDALVKQIDSLETIITEDERAALILESDLIKQHQPHYNIKLKDGKAHVVIRVDLNNPFPRLEMRRLVKNDGAKYFGPYAFSYEIRALLEIINQTMQLRTCSDNVMHNRVRPCLEYQIKRCSAPCCNLISNSEYGKWVEQALLVLDGSSTEIVPHLEAMMLKASTDLRFEDASRYRDAISLLNKMAQDKQEYEVNFVSRDVFGFYREGDQAEISVFIVRDGRIKDVHSYGLQSLIMDDCELFGEVLGQYYGGGAVAPDEILLPVTLRDSKVREELIASQRGRKTKILSPKRGSRARLVQIAQNNAKENYAARFPGNNQSKVLQSLQRALGLSEFPKTIECVDISHFQGTDTVASVVFFEEGKPNKSRYRKFKLSAAIEGKPDDFASMREVLKRHLSRCAEEKTLSDLMIIDGGVAQLKQGLLIKQELGLDKPEMIGLAKKRERVAGKKKMSEFEENVLKLSVGKVIKPERVFVVGQDEPIVLPSHSSEEYLIEQIRDEAHRFAIKFHRELRSKRVLRSTKC